VRLDQGGVGDESKQRAGVREGEEAIGNVAPLLAEEPDLQQRAGRSEKEEREADGQGEVEEDGGDRMGGAKAEIGADQSLCDQQDDGGGKECEVEQLSAAVEGMAGQPVRVEVAEQQGELEEDEAGEPDRRGAAERGEQLLGRHGLDQEEEKRREKDGKAVERPG